MLEKVKKALRITTNSFDDEIERLIETAIEDLRVNTGAEISVKKEDGEITKAHPLIEIAIITYCRCNFGSPDDYDRLKKSYDEQKAQIRCNSDFGMR